MYPALFRDYGDRRGKNWLKVVDSENRRVFGQIGYLAVGQRRGFAYLPKTGGTCRAMFAKRNAKGQFIS